MAYTTTLPTVEHTGLGDVPHSRCLHDVPDDKLLDGLVFGHAAGTVCAADGLNVATALLGTAVVPPFLGLGGRETGGLSIMLGDVKEPNLGDLRANEGRVGQRVLYELTTKTPN